MGRPARPPVLLGRYNVTAAERFWRRVDKTSTCWLWTGALQRRGYGWFRSGGNDVDSVLAHRAALELTTGKAVPPGVEVHHTCEVRACVRPSHLRVVTRREHKAEHRRIRASR